MANCIILARVSTEQQSYDEQLSQLVAKAKSDGYSNPIVIAKKESAIKLSYEEREGISKMKSVIENEDIDCLYIWELSRLSRRSADLYIIRDFLQLHHVNLKCLKPEFTLFNKDWTINSMSNIVFSLFQTIAENEMSLKKERFHRGKKRNAEEGKYNGGPIRYGYTKDSNNNIIINEEEANFIRLAFHLIAEKEYTYAQVYNELHSRGSKISRTQLYECLAAPVYTGIRCKSSRECFERVHPAIVSKELFDKARAVANKNRYNSKNIPNHYLGAKVIKCAECGSCMVVTGNPVKSYRCGQHKRENAYNMPHKCHSTITANANVVDSLLWSRASVKYIYYSISNHKDKKAQLEESIEILKKKLDTALEEKKKIKLKQERNENSYINMLISDDSYTKNKDKIAQELSRIAQDCVKYNSSIVNQEQQLKVLESHSDIPIESLVKLVNTTFENRDMAKMQEIVRMFIKELNVYYSEEDNKHKIYKITFQDGTVEYWRQDYYRTGMEYVERKISNDGLVVYIPAYNSSYHYRVFWEQNKKSSKNK